MLSVLGIPLLLMLMVFDYLFALIVSSNAVLNLMKSLRSWKQMDVFHQPKTISMEKSTIVWGSVER